MNILAQVTNPEVDLAPPAPVATATAPATTARAAARAIEAARAGSAASRPARTSMAGEPPLDEQWLMIREGTPDTRLYINYYRWFQTVPRADIALQALGVLILIPLVGYLIRRLFARVLERHQLVGVLRLASISTGIYVALWVFKLWRMLDMHDVLALAIHGVFIAIMLVVGIRVVDRLIIVPLLTRGGKATLSRFVHQIIVGVVAGFVALGYANWAFGVDVSSFLAGSAVISIVLGLALQETLGNFFSGMVIQASVPFQPGHWIRIGDVEGRVVEMTWRAVTLHTNDDNYVLIPNAMIAKEQIVNFSIPSTATARNVLIGLEYELTPNEAKKVLLTAALETDGVLHEPAPRVLLENYADSSIVYRVKFWINEPRRHAELENAVRVNAWYRLKQAGFEIPFQVRTVEVVDLDKKLEKQRLLAENERLRAIRRIPLLSALSDAQRTKLAREAKDLQLAARQVLYHQHAAGDSFYILLEGVVDIFVTGEDGKEHDIGDIVAGSFFGELSALTGEPRPTTIKAQTDIKCIEITRESLQALFAEDPTLMNHISEVVAQRQAERETKLRELGARKDKTPSQDTQAHRVLDRMKKMFGSLGKGLHLSL